MKHFGRYSFVIFGALLLLSVFVHGQQPWSNILSSSRANNWSNAGLPATLPDGETTPNPWTPPTRTQCGSTISGGTSGSPTPVSTINTAMAVCPAGTYVLLGSGYFAAANTYLSMYAQNGVSVRGSGPQSTILTITGKGGIAWTQSWGAGSATWASGYRSGSTSLTLTGAIGAVLTVGALLNLSQCNTGLTGSGCTTGSPTDNGGLYICGSGGSCSTSPGSYIESQTQTVYVTGVTGTCSNSCTVTFSPAIYMPNYATGNSPSATWQVYFTNRSVVAPYGNGLEDLTVYLDAPTSNPTILFNSYANWIKGVRIIGNNGGNKNFLISGDRNLVFNIYSYEEIPDAIQSGDGLNFFYTGSDNLILNYICGVGDCAEGEGSSNDVLAYGYSRDGNTGYYAAYTLQHVPLDAFSLFESNEQSDIDDDDTWGTHVLNTFFRNQLSCGDPPYVISGGGNAHGLEIGSFSRVDNVVGNVIGASGNCTSYLGESASGYVYDVNPAGTDSGTLQSLLLWGNVSTVRQASDTPASSGVRFVSSEVPTLSSIIGCATSSQCNNLSGFAQTAPGNDNLPCSFFGLTGTSASCTPFPSGGTGLSWWKVCTNWNTFPTSCSTTQTQPFPAAGPDVSGGPYVNGHAYDIPAAVAWKYLPVDPAWQNSYTIASSSWSGGVETLTFASGVLPPVHHLMGPFQLSGVNSACSTGATFGNNSEILMTGSTSTKVKYALASNPGVSCTGTMRFPDVREFDERVYGCDAASGAPGCLTGAVIKVQ